MKKKKRSENYRPKTVVGEQGKTICVNLFAGAGARKSTIACTLHGILKMHGITSEYTGEYAKDLAWEGRLGLKLNQVHIFGEQHNRQFRLDGQVDCIICDSPLLLSSVYRTSDSLMDALIMQEFNKYENINFYVNRGETYIKRGRKESENQATKIDKKIINLLNYKQIPYTRIEGTIEGINQILEIILKKLKVRQKYSVCRKK